MKSLRHGALTLVLLMSVSLLPAAAAELGTVRIGVLKFGTVNWTLSVIQDRGLAKAHGVDLQVIPLANKNAISVALQGGAVDMIVTDWIWVSRQRAAGHKFTFVPYSRTVGGVMVRPGSGIKTLADLNGKKLGVAGGPVDKSWLLLRAYARKTLGKDLTTMVEPNFGAPPLLNALLEKGDLDAVLNFWHYNARLKAAGMHQLIGIDQVLPALGVKTEVPLLGWVFDESWANAHKPLVEAFLDAASEAQQLMVKSDQLWTGPLKPLTKAENQATLEALRDGYRAGVPQHFGPAQIAAAKHVFAILAELGGQRLVGDSTTLSPGTFWSGYTF